MKKVEQKLLIGVLGGIGSGKSSVAAEFVKLGCKAVNADQIAHEVLQQPDIKQKIIDYFGDTIITQEGQIDRHKLARIAFSDPAMLDRLNSIVHPVVLDRCEKLIAEYNCQNDIKAIVLDMPLLVEVGWTKRCDILIFVNCEYEKRLQRVRNKGVIDENKLKIREKFQISLDTKAEISDIVIDNNSSLKELSQQVEEIFVQIKDL